jgi:hypothetical protein
VFAAAARAAAAGSLNLGAAAGEARSVGSARSRSSRDSEGGRSSGEGLQPPAGRGLLSSSSSRRSLGLGASALEVEAQASPLLGRGVGLTDAVLLDMLRRKPKHVPELQSRDSFRRFFVGMPRWRMLRLLRASCGAAEGAAEAEGANAGASSGGEAARAAEDRVARRMALVEDLLSDGE